MKHVQLQNAYNRLDRPTPQTQSFNFQSSTITYGGPNGAYYTSSTTRRAAGDGLTLEESKEADTTTGKAAHRVSRGIHDKMYVSPRYEYKPLRLDGSNYLSWLLSGTNMQKIEFSYPGDLIQLLLAAEQDGTFVFGKSKRFHPKRMKPAARKILSHDKDNHERGSGSGKATKSGNWGFEGPQKHNRFKKIRTPQTPKKIKKPDSKSPCLRCGAVGHWFCDCKTPWVPRVKVQANHITIDITFINTKLTASNFFGDTDASMDQHIE
ncbi:hypothetical protein GIB67_022251 [Kingdonia uniflora]|uniref:CCHC-type domain-containing protein n=1 Tax=Kingdonia uniflora TaxID=39325 RepID=A0A7J7M6Y1_9MAGN|nr:hypothetical protein GIB67_022251 [Kingdonia uniflora]